VSSERCELVRRARRSAFAQRAGGRGALLLEVVVAMAIMVTAMGLLGAQLVGGLHTIGAAEDLTRAAQLADRVLALIEMDPNTLERFFGERQIDGDFDSEIYPQYRGWFWRATVEKLPDNEDLGRVTIEILHQTDPAALDDIDGAQVVRQLHLLKAHPGRINLAEDFGVPEEQVELLTQMLPTMPGFDPTALDPQRLAAMDPQLLLELLPVLLPLLQQFGGGSIPQQYSPDMLRQLLTGDLSALTEGSGAELGGGGPGAAGPAPGAAGGAADLDALRELIKSQLGGQLSDQELEALLDQVGSQGAGGAGFGFGRPTGDGGEPRRGRSLQQLNEERNQRNQRFRNR